MVITYVDYFFFKVSFHSFFLSCLKLPICRFLTCISCMVVKEQNMQLNERHLLSLETLWAFSPSRSLRASKARGSIRSPGTRRTRCPSGPLNGAQRRWVTDLISDIGWISSLDVLVHTVHQKLDWQTYPFTFVSLRPLRSCEPVKATVSLQRQRRRELHFSISFLFSQK